MTDPLIREAFDAIAATAPPPERVRARIAARARVHRQRRALLVGAGALGGAAIGAALLHRRPGPAPQPAAPASAAGPSLLFAPAWLPDGLTEQYREVTYEGATGSRRAWLPAGVPYPEDHSPTPGITLVVGDPLDDDSGEPVTIGSVRGRLRDSDLTVVSWQPEGSPPLRVVAFQVPDRAAAALRVARSVTATTASVPVPLRLPAIPDRFRGYLVVSVHPRPGGWLASLTSTAADRTRSCTVIASTGAVPAHAYASAARPGGVTLWVPDEQEASANLTRDEADRALRELVWAAPDLSWVGKRVA